jgi:tetratricopeptide (TPR) repeat protein
VVAQSNRTGQLVKPPTANVDAYHLYLKGRALELQRGPALVHAVGCFESVVKLDPACASAYAELAKSLLLLSMWGLKDPRETHDRAGAAVQQALANDAQLSAGFAAQALYAYCVELDRDKATTSWQKAVEYDPSDGEARALRATYDHAYSRGNFDLAVAELQDVVAGDPLNVNVRAHLSLVYVFAERFDDAADTARRAIELEPTSFYAHWGLVFGLCTGPRQREGIVAAEAMLAQFGRHPWPMMALAIAYGGAGEMDKARAVHDELRARSRTAYVQPSPGQRAIARVRWATCGKRSPCAIPCSR